MLVHPEVTRRSRPIKSIVYIVSDFILVLVCVSGLICVSGLFTILATRTKSYLVIVFEQGVVKIDNDGTGDRHRRLDDQ